MMLTRFQTAALALSRMRLHGISQIEKRGKRETAAYFKSGLIGDCNSLLWSLNVNSDISENTQFQAACDELIDAIFEMMNTQSYLLPEKSEKKSDNEAWVTVQLQNPDGDLVYSWHIGYKAFGCV